MSCLDGSCIRIPGGITSRINLIITGCIEEVETDSINQILHIGIVSNGIDNLVVLNLWIHEEIIRQTEAEVVTSGEVLHGARNNEAVSIADIIEVNIDDTTLIHEQIANSQRANTTYSAIACSIVTSTSAVGRKVGIDITVTAQQRSGTHTEVGYIREAWLLRINNDC